MVSTFPLQSLFQTQASLNGPCACLKESLSDFFARRPVQLEEILEERKLWQTPLSDEHIVNNWKNLLVVTLLGYLSGTPSFPLAEKVQLLKRQPWNLNSQFMRALVALNHLFAGLPVPDVHPQLLENGAALIELQEYCPWLSLPYRPYHAEFGTYLCLLALLTEQTSLKSCVLQLAKWHLNTLDANFFPLNGLFVQEKDGGLVQHLLWNYLLFHGASQLNNDISFGSVAQAQLSHLQSILEQDSTSISPLFPLIERILARGGGEPNSNPLQLSEQIFDSSTSLIGQRSAQHRVVCTLHGGYTGLGCVRVGDVDIVNYGPQHLPLGECQGFGIEGNPFSDQGARKTHIEWTKQGFLMKGCSRLVDRPPEDPAASFGFHLGQLSGIWFETEQELKREHFHLKTSFLGFDGWDSIAFSFFVKAQKCYIDKQVNLNPKTLDRYEGVIQPVNFEGFSGALDLICHPFDGQMQVIPLGGGDNFWGADFLVAYLLNSSQRNYSWQINPAILPVLS